MSGVGLPMDGHVGPHLDPTGICRCPCDECTTRLTKLCVCLDCRCDEQADHAVVEGEITVWIDCLSTKQRERIDQLERERQNARALAWWRTQRAATRN